MTRILHTGDTHLGYQQYHLPARREDFRAAFEAVVDDAVDDDVDAVVHAGDLFHDRQPRLSDIMGVLSILRTLDEADIPFLAVVGNHETKRAAQWLDLFESMGLATRLGDEPCVVDDVAVYGQDFVPRSLRDDLDYEFEPHDQSAAVLVSHGLFEPFDHGDWDARRLLSESMVAFDAVLLGDDHEAKTRHLEEHDTWLTYCGSTERASASEREARGYNIVEISDTVDIRRRGLDTRDFEFVDVELSPGEGSQRVRERIDEYDVDDSVVIVTITGEGESVMPAGIEEYATDCGALVTRVNDQRELADEADVEVTFADPDEAITERIEGMGLSPAARDLDETIRASKVPDSRVADTVQRRVTEFVKKADPGAFESADDIASRHAEGSTETAAAEEADAAEKDSSTEAPAPGEDADPVQSANEDGQVTMEDYL